MNDFVNEDQYHAAAITTGDGTQLSLRTDIGQPLWARGVMGGNGQGIAQVAPEDWVTVSGTVSGVNASTLTFVTDSGEQVTLQLGQPDFWQSQGITFEVGDPISVQGFWLDTLFQAGSVQTEAETQLALRDDSGRPLWAGQHHLPG